MMTPEELHRNSLLATIEELHMNITGASDTMRYVDMIGAAKAIETRIRNWRPSNDFTREYDDAVLNLANKVLNEYTDWRNKK